MKYNMERCEFNHFGSKSIMMNELNGLFLMSMRAEWPFPIIHVPIVVQVHEGRLCLQAPSQTNLLWFNMSSKDRPTSSFAGGVMNLHLSSETKPTLWA